MLADHGDVFGVVDRKLGAFAGRQRDQIDGGLEGGNEGQQEQKRPEYAAEHDNSLRRSYSLSYYGGRRVCQDGVE